MYLVFKSYWNIKRLLIWITSLWLPWLGKVETATNAQVEVVLTFKKNGKVHMICICTTKYLDYITYIVLIFKMSDTNCINLSQFLMNESFFKSFFSLRFYLKGGANPYYFGTTSLWCMKGSSSSSGKQATPSRGIWELIHRFIYYQGFYFELLSKYSFTNR